MKMRMWNYAGLTAAILMAAGCAGSPSEGDSGSGAEGAADRTISEARAAIEKADDRGCLWRDAESILGEAEDAADAGEYAEAEELASEALFQAEQGMEQCDEQRRLFEEGTTVGPKGAADEVDGAVMGPAVAASGSGADAYTVERGDTLWGIAGMATVYDDPYQWPLIFKANRDRIEDADLIHPGQQFTIRRDYSRSEVEAAVEHARTRGEWSLGRTEQSDMRSLRR